MAFKVKDLHCFVEILEDGAEAIVQSGNADPNTKQVFVMPLITGSEKMAERMKVVAQEHANKSHNKVLHIRLSNREDLETIEEQLVQEANEYLKPPS